MTDERRHTEIMECKREKKKRKITINNRNRFERT